MKVALDPSTGVRVQVWRERQLFHARRDDALEPPEICLGVDLFEVIADLAGLDLDRPAEAEEAGRLARDAQERLADAGSAGKPLPIRYEQESERAT